MQKPHLFGFAVILGGIGGFETPRQGRTVLQLKEWAIKGPASKSDHTTLAQSPPGAQAPGSVYEGDCSPLKPGLPGLVP
jgi:hypothetical protein